MVNLVQSKAWAVLCSGAYTLDKLGQAKDEY